MPYIIALIIIVAAAGAYVLLRQPADSVDDASTPQASESISDTAANPTPDSDTQSSEPAQAQVNEYSAQASYFTPRRTEHEIGVTLQLQDQIIVAADVDYDGGVATTPAHSGFDAAYKTEVIGQDISTIELSRVGGASLTSTAFNEALDKIKAQI